MSIRQLISGLGRGSVASRRGRRSLRPGLEGLEKREVMTVAFTPAFGPETIFWRSNVGGHTAGSALVGPVTNPTVLNNPTVYLIFSGSSWTSATASKYASDAQAILASPYLSGLTQYGSTGNAVYGGYTIDSRTSPGNAGRDAEVAYALNTLQPNWQKPTGVAPNPGGNNVGAAGYLVSPVYVVIDDNGNGAGSNGGGTYVLNGTTYLTNAINLNNGTYEDSFTDLFSHELVERISDGNGAGIGMNAPVDVSGEATNAQIADNEPDGGRYGYRINGTIYVQAYWSVVDQKFIIPDGNQQTVTLQPIWNGTSFTGTFNLLAVQNAPSDAVPTGSPFNTTKTQLTLGNENFNFAPNSIKNVSLFTMFNSETTNQIWHDSGPGTNWTAITGANTQATQLVTDGTSTYMLANNGGVNQVWKYNGSGSNWTAITGISTAVASIVVGNGQLDMLASNGTGYKVWRYNGSGSNWTAITGVTSVSQIVSASSGLYMLGNNGGVNQVWQYSGAGSNWTPVTGTVTNVTNIVSTGANLFMLAKNSGGTNRVWQYSGSGTNWTTITGANTTVTQLTGCGDSLFMLGNNGGANVLWKYNGAGSNWTQVSPPGVSIYQVYSQGNALFMVTFSNGTYYTWQYSGTGSGWILVS